MNTKNYRTRQEFLQATNPKGKNYIIGLDVGYSGTKVFHEGGCFCVPSYAMVLNKGMIEVASDKDILYKEDGSDDIYMVGYNAQDMLDNANTNDTENELYSRRRYGNKQFQIICHVAIALAIMDKKDNREIIVQTGLPASYLDGDTPAIKKAISKPAKFSIKVGSKNWVSFDYTINEDNIYVMAQPMGGLYSMLIKNDGNFVPDVKKILCSNVLVMDIGFGTFDFYGIKNRSIDCTESVDNIGMREVFAQASKQIMADTNEDIRVAALQKHLETGKFTFVNEDEMKAEERSIAPYIEQANKKVLEMGLEKAKNVTNAFRGYKYIVISGGTGEAWLDDIRKWLENMKTLTVTPANVNDQKPMVYSNARGYYMYRYMQKENRK